MRYNKAMALKIPQQIDNERLMNGGVYVAMTLLIFVGYVLSPDWFTRSAIALLCIAFAIVYQFGAPSPENPQRAHLYFTVQLVIVTGLCLLARTGDPFNFPFFILSIQAMLVLRPRTAAVWIVLFYLVGCLTVALRDAGIGPVYILFYLAAYLFVAIFGYTLRQVDVARRHNEALLHELGLAQKQLQRLAVAEERNRLARELHDSTKQQAFALSGQLGAARALLQRNPQAAETHLQQAEALADSLRQELASMILDLRPPALSQQDLPGALRRYVEEWAQQQDILASFTVEGSTRALPAEVENTLFRIGQEALTNVARHSQARHVEARLCYAPEQVTIIITDDGRGFDPQTETRGVGLQSMRERAALLPHGTLTVESVPDAGTRVTASCRI